MIIVRQCALVGALVVGVQACATPVEIKDDVREVNPNDFDIGGDDAGAQGGQSGSGGVGGGIGQGGAGQGGAGGVSSTVGGSSGLGGRSGAGGAGTGGTGVGTGGTGNGGQGGAAGSGGGAAGTGAGGVGGGSSANFDPAACDFADPAGCETRTCQAACPTNDGNSCLNRCVAVIACVSSDVCNITEADPLCGVRVGGQPSACTNQVESAGGNNPNPPTAGQAPQPSFVAREFVRCICSDPRP